MSSGLLGNSSENYFRVILAWVITACFAVVPMSRMNGLQALARTCKKDHFICHHMECKNQSSII